MEIENLEGNQPAEETVINAENTGAEGEHQISETEKEARTLGWKSQEEYKGEGWKPAEDFVTAKKTTLTTEVRALRNSIEQKNKAVDALLAHQARKEEADRQVGYQQAVREINGRIVEAGKAGNVAAITELTNARENLARNDEAQKFLVNGQTDMATTVNAWKSENKWYESDDDLTRYARAYELELTQKGVPLAQRLQQTSEKVKQAFPYKFEQQKRTQVSTMATQNKTVGGGNRAAPGTYEALTPQAKKDCDQAFSAIGGRFKKEDFQANYVKFAKPEMFQN